MSKEVPKSILGLFLEILKRLPTRRRRQFFLIFAAVICVAVLEPIALSSLAAFASAVTDPEAILKTKYVAFARTALHLDFLSTTRGIITSLGVIVVVLALLKSGLDAFVTYVISRFATMIEGLWGVRLLYGLLTMPYESLLSYNSADLIQVVQWRLYLGRHFINPCLSILSDLLMVIFILLTLLLFQPGLSIVVFLVFGGAAFLIYSKVRKRLDRVAQRCQQYELSLNRQITRSIHGVKDIKISGKESGFVEHFKEDVYLFSYAYGASQFFTRLPVLLLETMGLVTVVGTICLMLFVMSSSTAEITGFVALLIIAFWRLMPIINRMLGGITGLGAVLPYVRHELSFLKLIEAHSEDYSGPITTSKDRDLQFAADIRLDRVSFNYQNKSVPVLKNITFDIKKGQTVGIIGASGSGKSTLVNIIIGLLKPTEGQILIDGKVLDESVLADWIKIVGYVPQSPYIYDGNLAENVAFSPNGLGIDRERVQKCCEMAGLRDFLNAAPLGLETHIGERGVLLSGGQQQRIAIARSLYHNPEIVIFDEATSALDKESERAVQGTIYELKGKLTLIIIAHRLTSVKDCDYLVWIEGGEIKMIDAPEKVLTKYDEGIGRSELIDTLVLN